MDHDVFMMTEGGARVKVGTAMQTADGFLLTVGGLSTLVAAPARATVSGPVFPNYGRGKGQPILGASASELEYYAAGCQKTLDDPSKSRWHDKELALLTAIRDEQARQAGPSSAAASKPAEDSDVPF